MVWCGEYIATPEPRVLRSCCDQVFYLWRARLCRRRGEYLNIMMKPLFKIAVVEYGGLTNQLDKYGLIVFYVYFGLISNLDCPIFLHRFTSFSLHLGNPTEPFCMLLADDCQGMLVIHH